MTLNLTSCRLRLGRASEHLGTLKDEISAWSDTNPYSVDKDCNADATRYIAKVRVHNEPPLERWSLIAGDCIHDLRCALDHLVYAVAIHETQTDPPPEHASLMFPICDSRANFDKTAPRRIGTLSDPVRAEIERLQPYNRPHEELPPVLSVLRNLNDSDKHRLVNMTIAQVLKGEFKNIHNLVPGQFVRLEAHTGSVQNGTEIASITLDRPTPNVQYDFVANLTIAVRHATGPKGHDLSGVTNLLKILRIEVEDVVHFIECVSSK